MSAGRSRKCDGEQLMELMKLLVICQHALVQVVVICSHALVYLIEPIMHVADLRL